MLGQLIVNGSVWYWSIKACISAGFDAGNRASPRAVRNVSEGSSFISKASLWRSLRPSCRARPRGLHTAASIVLQESELPIPAFSSRLLKKATAPQSPRS